MECFDNRQKLILISSGIIFIAISLILVQKHKPENILNPYLAGPKTRDLFARQPMLGGFATMLLVVGIMATLMIIIN